MQVADEGFAGQQIPGLGPGRPRGRDGRGNGGIPLVVLQLAQARRERDLEDEKLAVELRRVDVIGQARAIAHAEPNSSGQRVNTASIRASSLPRQLYFVN